MSAYIGNDIVLRFVNLNDYSNSTFIDNIALNSTLSNEENTLANLVQMYPNPTSTIVSIQIDSSINDTIDIQIMNSLGQIIDEINQAVDANTTIIDVNNYQSGLYFVNIAAGNLQTTKKLIIK